MANLPISGLASGAAVSDGNLFPNVQTVGVGPVKTTALQIKTYSNTTPTITGQATFNAGATFAGYVGIGTEAWTAAPTVLLYLNDPTDDSGPNAVRMIIRAGTGGGTAYGGIRFQMRDHTTGWGCDIQAVDDTSAAGGAMRFRTGSGVSTTPTEAMRISSARNVGIRNTSPGKLLSIGQNGSSNGEIGLYGSTSGVITIQSQAAAGTYNFNLPTTSGSAGQVLTSAGGGATAMSWETPPYISAISTITTSGSITTASGTVLCNATSGAITVTLPAANSCSGRVFTVKKIDSSVNAVTLSSADLIDGASTKVISSQYGVYSVQSNGTSWWVV